MYYNKIMLLAHFNFLTMLSPGAQQLSDLTVLLFFQ